MKTNLFTLALYLFTLESCQGSENHSLKDVINGEVEKIHKKETITINDTLKKVGLIKKWIFKVNNADPLQIGYKTYTDDESIGVKGICVDGEYAYITDVYHTSIKRINITTGELLSSKPLSNLPSDKSGIWLREISVFNNKIYVTSDMSSIYVFSLELELIQSIPVLKGRKKIESINEKNIEILLYENQLADKSIEKTLFSIDKNGDTSTIKRQMPIQEYKKVLSQKRVQGKSFQEYSKNNRYYLKNEYCIIELSNPIPDINTYDARNLNFDFTSLVFFDSTPAEFTLCVYKY
jgi:hypothetical protein